MERAGGMLEAARTSVWGPWRLLLPFPCRWSGLAIAAG